MRNRFQTRQVVAVSAAHLVHDVFGAFLAPLLPLLIAKLGLSLSLAGVLDVARKSPALLNPFVGLVADRMPARWLVIVTPAVTATTMCLLGVAPSFPVLLALLLVSGLSAIVFHVPGPVLIKHFSGDRTGRGMSFYMFGGEAARTLGPLLITAALSAWGLEGSVRLLPLGLAASAVLYLRLRNLKPIDTGDTRAKLESKRGSVRPHLPLLAGLGGFLLLRMGIKSALTLYLPTYLVGKGQTLWVAGAALALLQAAGAVSTFAAGWIADHFGHRRTLLVVALLTPPATVALTFSTGAATVPLLLLSGFLIFAQGPILLALVQDTGTSRPAFLNSLYMTQNWLISALAVLAIGAAGDRFGLDATFRASAALSIFAAPFLFLTRSRSSDAR